MLYFDNAATTKVSEEVVTDIIDSLRNDWANPSSISEAGIEVKKKIERARKQIADYINADPEEIIFTGSGSEANNLAIKGFFDANANYRFDCLVSTKIEHPSVYEVCKEFIDKCYHRVEFIPVDHNGIVDPGHFQKAISLFSERYYCFVSIMLANNEIGSIQPVKKLTEYTHKYNGVFHTDATQAFGKIPIDVKDLGVDLMSVSLHKIGLPKGIGFLYKKKGIILSPIIHGGHQEMALRAGTENTAYIIAAGNQIERIKESFMSYEMIDYLSYKIISKCYDCCVDFSFNGWYRMPNILSITFEGINAEAFITLLDIDGIQVSAGSACCAGSPEPSRVLRAIGLSDEEAFSTIRISIGNDTTKEECDEFVKVLGKCLESLKMVGGE
jgi:cysteine desulfurase